MTDKEKKQKNTGTEPLHKDFDFEIAPVSFEVTFNLEDWAQVGNKYNANMPPDFITYTQDQKNIYTMIKQDTTTNALARVSSKSGMEIDKFAGVGVIKAQNGKTDLQVILTEYDKITLKQSTSKLLRLITIYFTENGFNDRAIMIPLKDVMNDLGMTDEKDARANIKKDLRALYNLSIKGQVIIWTGEKIPVEFRIIDKILGGTGIKNSMIGVQLTEELYTHLKTCPVMVYNKDLLKIKSNSQKNPYAFYLGDKITELMKYNLYDTKTQKQKPYFITTVKTLLEVCIANGMTRYEDLKEKSRHVDKLIITPFERDLDTCSANFFDWEYCNEKGTPLRPEQTEDTTPAGKYRAQSYKEFESLHIKITPQKDYPIADYNTKKLHKEEKKTSKKNKKSK